MNLPPATTPVLGRLLRPLARSLRDEVLQAFCIIQASPEESARYHHLADKNTEGTLSPDERQELESIVVANTLLSLLRKEAKNTLNSQA